MANSIHNFDDSFVHFLDHDCIITGYFPGHVGNGVDFTVRCQQCAIHLSGEITEAGFSLVSLDQHQPLNSVHHRRQDSWESQTSTGSDNSDTATYWTGSPDSSSGSQLFEDPETIEHAQLPVQSYQPTQYPTIPVNHRHEFLPVGDFNPPLLGVSHAGATGAAVGRSTNTLHGQAERAFRGKPAKCICGADYHGEWANSNLARHIRNMLGGPFVCDYCRKKFKYTHNLVDHLHRKHYNPALDELLQCDRCKMVFTRQDDLEKHRLTCSGNKLRHVQ